MGLLAHCVVPRPNAASEVPDRIAGRTVRLIEVGDLALVVSETDGAPATDPDAVMAFEAVVEWFLRRYRSVIPIRLGRVLTDEEAAARIVRERAPEYRRLVHELEDTVEVGIRVLPERDLERQDATSSGIAQSGAAWLEQRRQHYGRLERAVAHLDGVGMQLKAELADAFLRSREEARPGMLSLYFLVPRPRAESFLERASRVKLPGVKVLVSGPWPPYNFVDSGMWKSGRSNDRSRGQRRRRRTAAAGARRRSIVHTQPQRRTR